MLKDLAASVGQRLRKAGQKAGMVSVEIKYHTFNQVSHQMQMEKASNQDQDIYRSAIELFRELWNGEPIRLLGIRTSKLSEESEPEQLSLFDMKFESEETRKKKKNLCFMNRIFRRSFRHLFQGKKKNIVELQEERPITV